jgi:hypothetical protein
MDKTPLRALLPPWERKSRFLIAAFSPGKWVGNRRVSFSRR